jgi:hypothetical protein
MKRGQRGGVLKYQQLEYRYVGKTKFKRTAANSEKGIGVKL